MAAPLLKRQVELGVSLEERLPVQRFPAEGTRNVATLATPISRLRSVRRPGPARSSSQARLHPLGAEFLDHLTRVNERWHQTASAVCRHFCAWLQDSGHLPPGTELAAIDLAQLTRDILACYAKQLEVDYPNGNTRRSKLYGLRRWFRYLVDHGHIASNPCLSLPPVPREPSTLDRMLTADHVAAFFQAVYVHSPFPERDVALFGLLANLGLRPGEVVGLTVGSLDLLAGLIKVHGKGNRERLVPLNGPVMSAIERYLPYRQPASDDEPLWIEKGSALTPDKLRSLFHHYREVARIPDNIGGPHVFRHFFITQNLLVGADLRDLAAVVGHTNVRSLETYFHVSTETLRTGLNKALGGEGETIEPSAGSA